MSYATFRFDTEAAANAAADALRKHGYEVSPDVNDPARGFQVAYDSSDALTDGPTVELGADFERLERIAARLGGHLDSWTVSRFDRFTARPGRRKAAAAAIRAG